MRVRNIRSFRLWTEGDKKNSLGKVVKTHSAIKVSFSLTAFSGQKGGDFSRCQARMRTKNFRLEMTVFSFKTLPNFPKRLEGRHHSAWARRRMKDLHSKMSVFSFKPPPNLPKDIEERNFCSIFFPQGVRNRLVLRLSPGGEQHSFPHEP